MDSYNSAFRKVVRPETYRDSSPYRTMHIMRAKAQYVMSVVTLQVDQIPQIQMDFQHTRSSLDSCIQKKLRVTSGTRPHVAQIQLRDIELGESLT